MLSLLWHGFDPQSGNFHMMWVQQNKQKQSRDRMVRDIQTVSWDYLSFVDKEGNELGFGVFSWIGIH